MDQYYAVQGQYHQPYPSGSQEPSGSTSNDFSMHDATGLSIMPTMPSMSTQDMNALLSQTHSQPHPPQHHHIQNPNYATNSSQPHFDSPSAPINYDPTVTPQQESFLRPLPSSGMASSVDPSIQLELLRETRRIRELELQITEASLRDNEEKRKIREAELAIAELKASSGTATTPASVSASNDGSLGSQVQSPVYTSTSISAPAQSSTPTSSSVTVGESAESAASGSSGPTTGGNVGLWSTGGGGSKGHLSLDDVFDAAHWANFSSSWLGAGQAIVAGGGGGFHEFGKTFPSSEVFGQGILEPDDHIKSFLEQQSASNSSYQDSPFDDHPEDSPNGHSSHSPGGEADAGSSKLRKAIKSVESRNVNCTKCNALIAKLALRGTKEELEQPVDLLYQCLTCAPPESPSNSAAAIAGSKGSRKRMNELDDTEKFVSCDVCTHVKGYGGLRTKSREHIEFTAEFICLSCSEKYRRCTNCGGTSARGIVGKWRCKELFAGGRKTCSLSHARLGALDMELAVWNVPTELVNAAELPALLECCEDAWREHILGKIAVPEVLEHQTDVRTYGDIEKFLLVHEFPGKALFTQPTKTPNHRRYVSLHWAKTRTRRNKSKPEWALVSHEEKMAGQAGNEGWLTYNTRRSNVIRPSGAILCGCWMVEWIIPDKTAVVSTITPFDTVTTDERAPLHLSEIFRRALQEMVRHNATNPEHPWNPPEHCWMLVSKSGITSRLRLTEGLERRSILPLEEYITRHPEVRAEMFDPRICSLSEHLIQRRPYMKFEVQVRHIGLAATPEMVEKRAQGRLRRSVKKGR